MNVSFAIDISGNIIAGAGAGAAATSLLLVILQVLLAPFIALTGPWIGATVSYKRAVVSFAIVIIGGAVVGSVISIWLPWWAVGLAMFTIGASPVIIWLLSKPIVRIGRRLKRLFSRLRPKH